MNDPHPVFSNESLLRSGSWIVDIMGELRTRDAVEANRVLRAVLEALRNVMPAEGRERLAAELPPLIRRHHFECGATRPTNGRTDRCHDLAEHLASRLGCSHGDAERCLRAVGRAMVHRIARGEMADVRPLLPEEIRLLMFDAKHIDRAEDRRGVPLASPPP